MTTTNSLDNNRGILTRLQETQWSAAQRTVQRIHRNLGHPTNLELAKLLKSKNASPSIVAAAQQHHCQLCDAHRPPPQVAKSTLLSLGGNEDIGRNLSQFNFVFSQSFDVWYLSECGHARTYVSVFKVGHTDHHHKWPRAHSEQEAVSTAEYKQTQSGYTYRDYTMATSHKQFQSSA